MKLDKILYCPSCIFFVLWSFAIIIFSLMFSIVAIETILYFLIFFIFMFIGNLIGTRFTIVPKKSVLPSEKMLRSFTKVLFFVTLIYSFQMIIYILNFDSPSSAFLDI